MDALFGEDGDDDMFKVSSKKSFSTTHPSKPFTSPKPVIPSKPKVTSGQLPPATIHGINSTHASCTVHTKTY